jgi:hypothetical protein
MGSFLVMFYVELQERHCPICKCFKYLHVQEKFYRAITDTANILVQYMGITVH